MQWYFPFASNKFQIVSSVFAFSAHSSIKLVINLKQGEDSESVSGSSTMKKRGRSPSKGDTKKEDKSWPQVYAPALDNLCIAKDNSGSTNPTPTRPICNLLPEVLCIRWVWAVKGPHEANQDWLQQIIELSRLCTKIWKFLQTLKNFLSISPDAKESNRRDTTTKGKLIRKELLHRTHQWWTQRLCRFRLL